MDHPDINDRIAEIQQLCDSNGTKLIVSIIPTLAPDGSRKLNYVNADPKLFPNTAYYEPHNLLETDYCTGTDGHLNEIGHKKYAAFVKGLIDSVGK